jgi:hypothetical protein
MSNPIQRLNSTEAIVRQQALLDFMQSESNRTDAEVLAILQALKDSNQGVRVNAALVLTGPQ